MTLLKREYFYLPEVVQKLEITEFDLQYYLSHGQILGSAWLNKREFTYDSWDVFKEAYVGGMPYSYEGYISLSSSDCRELFSAGHLHSREFFLDYPETRLTLPADQPGILIRRADLMISVWDLEAFAEQYGSEEEEKKPAGRPTVMPKILQEHARRINSNEACKNRTQEAWILRQWAELHLKNQPAPSQKTIYNELIKKSRKQPSEKLGTVA